MNKMIKKRITFKKIMLSLSSIMFFITLTGCIPKGDNNEISINSKLNTNVVEEETQNNSNNNFSSCH